MKKNIFVCSLLVAASLLSGMTGCTNRRDEIAEKLTQEAESGESALNRDFYAGMTSEDMLNLYETHTVLEAPAVGMELVNTPYYYIMPLANMPGGHAYSKISGTFVTMCTDHIAIIMIAFLRQHRITVFTSTEFTTGAYTIWSCIRLLKLIPRIRIACIPQTFYSMIFAWIMNFLSA